MSECQLGKRFGNGTFNWPSGATYTGAFDDDKRHGYGEMNYADGSTYKGMWVDDKRTRGTFVFTDATAVYTPIGEDGDNFSGE